jgi:hypothetical protein
MYIDHTMEPRGYVLRFQFLIQDYSPSVTLKWGESLSEFTPRISTVGQVFGISTRIWVPSIKMEFVIILSWDFDRAAFDLQVYPGLGSLQELLGSEKAQSVVKIDAIGPATAPKQILAICYRGSTIGSPVRGARSAIRASRRPKSSTSKGWAISSGDSTASPRPRTRSTPAATGPSSKLAKRSGSAPSRCRRGPAVCCAYRGSVSADTNSNGHQSL